MQIQTHLLIEDLLGRTERSTESVKRLKELTPEQLNFKRSATEWSILECIEHLNLYGDFYLVEIEKQIIAHKTSTKQPVYTSGPIGNYFANLMLVKNGNVKKMKSPKDKNPSNTTLTLTTIDRFLKQQERLNSLLLQAQYVDLTKTKAAISLTKFIRLRLGDTLRFFVYHIERHVLQAEKIQTAFKSQQLRPTPADYGG